MGRFDRFAAGASSPFEPGVAGGPTPPNVAPAAGGSGLPDHPTDPPNPQPGALGNGLGWRQPRPDNPPNVGSPFDPPANPPASDPTGYDSVAPATFRPPDPPVWEDPYALTDTPDQTYAMESRAETINVFTRGNAVRKGEKDYLRAGSVDSFADIVAGEENVTVTGKLTERVGRASRTVASEVETTVHGRMSTSAIGWKSSPFSGEDSIILGGALTDTWTGGLLIGAAISDDLMAGAGVRLTAPADLWLNQLTGMQERAATAVADAALIELYGTMFEREYGAGAHTSALACFSGTVWQTQRVGFRPLMKTAMGVRNLIPASGGPATEQTPPAPPAAPPAGGDGVLIATDVAAGAAGSAQSVDNLQDMGRLAGAADELEDVSELRHAEDTVSRLEELSSAARTADVEAPNGMAAGAELPARPLPDGFDSAGALNSLDDTIQARMDRIEALEGVVTQPLDQINVLMADRIDELSELTGRVDDFAGGLATVGDDVATPQIGGSLEQLEDLDDARRAELETELAKVRWPGEVAEGEELRRLQLEAEIDALMAVRTALEAGEDPVEYLRQMGAYANELYGATDPRSQALADAATYYSRLTEGVGILQDEIDLLIAARADILQGFDPRVSVQNAAAGVGSTADAQRQAGEVLDFLNAAFDFGARPDDLDVMPPSAGSADVLNPGLGDESRIGTDVADLDNVAENGVQFSSRVVAGNGIGDEGRLLLDIEAENVVDAAEEGASGGARLDVNGGGTQNTGVQPPIDGNGPPLQPRLDESGAGWSGSQGANALADGGDLSTAGPGYQGMEAAGDAAPTESVAVSTDTQAVIDGAPMYELPDDFNWAETRQALEDQYMDYRRGSNWRGALAYADAKNGLSDELLRAISDFTTSADDIGANADELSAHANQFSEASASQRYQELQRLLTEAVDSDNVEQAQRIADFLEQHDLKTYNMYQDLASRTAEFDNAANAHLLDRHIDSDKLIEWLTGQMMEAHERMNLAQADEAKDAASKEMAFFHQLILAVQEGRSPLAESADQIALLQTAGESAQAQRFDELQQGLLDVLGNAEFHRPATELGDNTYAPAAFLRPELGDASPAGGLPQTDFETRLFEPRVEQPDGASAGGEVGTGDYPANRDTINRHAGDGDAARAPDQQPAGIAEVPEDRGTGILRNAQQDPNVHFDPDQVINRISEGLDDQSATLWARRMRDEASGIARRTQGGVANFMDQSAQLLPPHVRNEIDLSTLNPYAAERLDAANQYWDSLRIRDTRPPSEWSRAADVGTIRSWDSAAQQRRSVRFGDASVIEVLADAEDVRKADNQFRDLRNGNAAMDWWTGSGINRPTDSINADEAVRHVPTPQGGRRRGGFRPSGWTPSRQPGFGRVADAPGSFPFSVREQVINDLMQGQRLDARHIDALQSTVNDGVRADRIRHREWLRMSALLRSLRSGTVLGDARGFARALDWRTLGVLLDMLDSAASLA